MKSSELTNPGPNWQGLRHDVARAVSEALAQKSVHTADLQAMLEDAAAALVEVPEDPEVPEEE